MRYLVGKLFCQKSRRKISAILGTVFILWSQAVKADSNPHAVVLFDHDSTQISQIGKEIISQVSLELQEKTNQIIRLVGHADSTGSRSYNIYLSRSRAIAVKNQFNWFAIDDDRILIEAYGEENQPYPTKDNTPLLFNRSVEIFFENKPQTDTS